MAIFEASPVPNQMITIGARAMIGIEPRATMNGWTTRETKREYHKDRPSTVPRMLPARKPRIVSSPVTQVSRTRLPSCHILTRKPPMALGEPNRKAACLFQAVAYSHRPRNTARIRSWHRHQVGRLPETAGRNGGGRRCSICWTIRPLSRNCRCGSCRPTSRSRQMLRT